MLKQNDKMPDFNLKNADGNEVKSSELLGKKLVIYFYPKNDTPGCTKEACSFRDSYDEILEKGAVVIGISADSESSHGKFRKKYNLPFYLLSDPEKKTIESFGAWGLKKMYGKEYYGIIRSTFIINEKGQIAHVFPKVSPEGHADAVIKVLETL